MKHRLWLWIVVLAGTLAVPATARANFSVFEFPEFAEDHAPDWLFQILAGILLGLLEVLEGLLGFS